MSAEKSPAKETARSNYEERKQKQLEERKILEPDNPLLEKFQKALKEHLLLQIEALKSDIFEYETGAKKKNAERTELGLRIYEEQQVANKRQTVLENCIKQVETTSAARIENERILIERKEVYKKERQNFIQAEQEEIELKKDVEATNLLTYQISNWENTLETNIYTKMRTFEKTRQEKLRLLEEKRLQDGLIYKLMVRSWEFEAESDKMNTQLKLLEVEREELAQTVALGNTNIEAITLEYRSMMDSWNSVIVSVGHRNKIVSCLGAELYRQQDKFKNTLTEIEQVKKLSEKEMQKNEYLTLVNQRFTNDVKISQARRNEELMIKNSIERKINETQAITDRTEEDIERVSIQIGFVSKTHADVMRHFEKMMHLKADIEEDLLRKLEDRSTHDQAAMHMRTEHKVARRLRRQLEATIVHCQNQTAKNLLQAEIQKAANDVTQKVLDEVEERVRKCQKQSEDYDHEIKITVSLAGKCTKHMDLLNRHLFKIIDNSGGVLLSPMELKISVLEKEICELQIEITELQDFWMTEQGHLIFISRRRQEQIFEQNLLRKHAMLTEQNNLKVTDSLNEYKSKCDQITRNVNHLRNKLNMFSEQMYEKRGVKNILETDNYIVQQKYANKLKDTELECLRLSSEIEQIKDDQIHLDEVVIGSNREMLEWEKKFKMAKGTKEDMVQERGKGGGLHNLQADIHRMHAHYSQLKKAQQSLVEDLETCVTRREAICNVARAVEKRKGGVDKTRWNISRKLDDMRNRLKQMANEAEANRKKICAAQETQSSLEFDVYNLEREIVRSKSTFESMKEELEENKSEKQLIFELVLMLQKRLALYNIVRRGRKPNVIRRTESAIADEHISANVALSIIIDKLKTDCPNQRHELVRLSNTLSLNLYAEKRREERKKH